LGGVDFMKKIQDERIINGRRKINSDAFGICFIALWGIILYRQFILHQNPSEYRDIFLLAIGISIYVNVNNVFSGFYSTDGRKTSNKKVIFIGALVGSITFTVIQYFVMNYDITQTKDILKILVQNIIFFSLWVIIQFAGFKIGEKQANKDIY